MNRDEIVALFARRDEHWRQRDSAALAADFTDDALAESPMQGKLAGAARIREVYEQWFTAFPDVLFKTDDLFVDGARVVQFFTISGTQTRPFGGLGATGRKFQVTGVSVSTLSESGRITHERRVYDVTSMLVQLGALRAKPIDELDVTRLPSRVPKG